MLLKTIKTDLEPNECINLITKSINVEESSLISSTGNKAISGIVAGSKFKIHKKINYRNGYQIYLYGKIIDLEKNNKGVILYYYSVNKIAKFFTCIVTIFIAIAVSKGGLIEFIETMHSDLSLHELGPLGVGLALILFIWGIYFIGRWISIKEKDELHDFLINTLGVEKS